MADDEKRYDDDDEVEDEVEDEDELEDESDESEDVVSAVYDDEDDDLDAADHAASVAKALGVGDEDEEEEEEGEGDPKAPVNRAQRRRQRALRRRAGQRRAGQAGGDEDGDGDDLPAKDRNARRRAALLKRRRAAAAQDEEEEATPDKLLPSEMVDDALARGGAASVKWLKRNWSTIQWVLIVAVVGTAGVLYYRHYTETSAEEAALALAKAMGAEEATVIPKDVDERTEDQKKWDVRDIYATEKERQEASLASYRKVIADHGGSGASILARLGEGGVLLDQREWDQAISAFDAVLQSKLAPADPDVQMRALEGKGFALEGKEDLDGALKVFEQLSAVSGEGFELLGLYHQARVMLAKDQKDRAKELLVDARSKLEKAKLAMASKPKLTPLGLSATSPYEWLSQAVDEELRALDPAAVPAVKPSFPGGGKLTPEQIKQILQQQGAQPGMPGR